MSDNEVYQDDHVPEGARSNRWQSLHVVCKYRDHLKPVYSLQRHLDVWYRGASAKNVLHCKAIRSATRRCLMQALRSLLGYRGKNLKPPPTIGYILISPSNHS